MADHPVKVLQARMLGRLTTPEARIAVVWAGITPYFAGRQAIDLLGKRDKRIARLPMRPRTDRGWGMSRRRRWRPSMLK